MKTELFDYALPSELIAQEPLYPRDSSRLLVVERDKQSFKEYCFKDFVKFFTARDFLIFNNTKVIPARIWGRKLTGGKIEFLLVREKSPGKWDVLIKPARRIRELPTVVFNEGRYRANIEEKNDDGTWLARFDPPDVRFLMDTYGVMPVPPYIKKNLKDQARYQTIYAREEGAIAAPTAGLHFTEAIFNSLVAKQIAFEYITLHVGVGTFKPLSTNNAYDHKMEAEEYFISENTAQSIMQCKKRQGRICAVGTTVVRTLEDFFQKRKSITALTGTKAMAHIYILPGFQFQVVDVLLTNFHLPCSTNYAMVCAFAGIELIKKAYQYAIENKFRFYSFGDAMLIL